MTEGNVLLARDLSLIEGIEPGSDWDQWLTELQSEFQISDQLISLSDSVEEDDEWIISRNEWGHWVTGRFVGEISFQGRRLEIRPRFEGDFTEWLEGAFNVAIISNTSEHEFEGSFMAWVLATIWARAFELATRHGLPVLRRDQVHEGEFIRGRLDVRRTMRLKARGSLHAASVVRSRDLANDISRTLIAAERSLSSSLGGDYWQPAAVKDALGQIRGAVGPRPKLPSRGELNRIRYTPITRPFRSVAELSWRIARREGMSTNLSPGSADGVLLDAAELWELFLVACLKEALPECQIDHGSTSDVRTYLLSSETREESKLGRLKPDILVYDRNHETLVSVIDAKYKHLRGSQHRPSGVDRGDLYQLTSYLSRYDASGEATGMLMYPLDPELQTRSTAELGNPWSDESGRSVYFVRIPTSIRDAVPEIRRLVRSE